MERKDVNLNDVSPMMREYLKTKSEYEGIILFYRLFCKIIERKFKNRVIIYVLKIALVSISAQILIMPIMLYSFNNLSFNFVISNILVSFLVSNVSLFSVS